MTDVVRHKDFTRTKKHEPVTFTLDGDTFHCVRKMPGGLIKKVTSLGDIENKSVNDKIDTFMGLLKDLLLDDSYEIFNARLNDKTNPIDIEEMGDIIEWLIEVYTGRPLVQSSESVDGSTTDSIVNVGTSLTDGVQAEMLIPSNSPQTVF